jgi:predicted small secreted protein
MQGAGLESLGGVVTQAPPSVGGAHLPLQSSQRAKEQWGASLCMRVAVSRVTTSCTPRTAWGKGQVSQAGQKVTRSLRQYSGYL